MLSYLIRSEMKDEREAEAARFKNEMFNVAFLTQNPEFYKKIYPEDFGMDPEEEMTEIDWFIPESEEDALAMFRAAFDAGRDESGLNDSWLSLPLLDESQSG